MICSMCEGLEPADCLQCEGEVLIRIYRRDCTCAGCEGLRLSMKAAGFPLKT